MAELIKRNVIFKEIIYIYSLLNPNELKNETEDDLPDPTFPKSEAQGLFDDSESAEF